MAFDIIANDAPTAFDIVINDASVGSSAGVATVGGIGSALATALGDVDGSASTGATGFAFVEAVGSAAGSSSASAVGSSIVEAVGSSAGSSTAVAMGIAIAHGVGASAGLSTASADGSSLSEGVGSSSGSSTAEASGTAAVIGIGSAAGSSIAIAFTLHAYADYTSSLRLFDMSYQIGQGDREPDIIFEAGVNGDPVNLTDAIAYVLRWWRPNGEVVDVEVSPVNISLGTFTRLWAPGDTDIVGTHRAKLIVTRGNGEQQTFPSDGSFLRWRVT